MSYKLTDFLVLIIIKWHHYPHFLWCALLDASIRTHFTQSTCSTESKY